ncbi:hypothetical protein EYF80_047774 [Liparis tanakae]|uniref:Uncharacterized protein n=1 Tax=Liparis tanakae TaxID=230148 RepID=A0A4Z2FM02_9TELE|nr:hypothetical protein EYF80_047774 [Liparis tanakae]
MDTYRIVGIQVYKFMRELHQSSYVDRLTAVGDMSQSLADSGDPMSSFPLLSSSFFIIGSSESRMSKACWNSLAAY